MEIHLSLIRRSLITGTLFISSTITNYMNIIPIDRLLGSRLISVLFSDGGTATSLETIKENSNELSQNKF